LNDTASKASEYGQWNYAYDPQQQRGYIYYVTDGDGTIRRLKDDASAHEHVLTPGYRIISNVAVDEVDQVIYYLTESPSTYPTTYGLEQPHALWAYSMRHRMRPVLVYDGLLTCRGLTLDRSKGIVYLFNYVRVS
jgi:hypothetical protein